MTGKKSARRYSPEENVRAVARGLEVGAEQAARELVIPPGTVRCWLYRARQERGPVPKSAEAHQAAGASKATGATARPSMKKVRGYGECAKGLSAVGDLQREPEKDTDAGESSPSVGAASAGSVDRHLRPTPGGARASNGVARRYTPTEKGKALEGVAKDGISATHGKLGISRFTLYDWRRRVRLAAEGKISESPVGGSDSDPGADRDKRILEAWRANPGLGPSQVRNQLRRQSFKVSVHTVRRVMEENGYVVPKVRRQEAHDRRYEAIRPNQLWHLDFIHRYVNKQSVYVLFLVDDYSRYLVGASMWDGERADAVIETFEQAVSCHGRPESVMSDGGSAFWAWRGVSRFTRLLEELGIDQLIARTPQVNGKCEVLNATVAKELFSQEKFFDLAQAGRRLEAWVSFYNLRRTHHALGGLLVPADRYFGRAAEVLAALESGASAEGHGEPLAIGDRQLDLLKVVSHKGQVEIWCMGRRLWSPA